MEVQEWQSTKMNGGLLRTIRCQARNRRQKSNSCRAVRMRQKSEVRRSSDAKPCCCRMVGGAAEVLRCWCMLETHIHRHVHNEDKAEPAQYLVRCTRLMARIRSKLHCFIQEIWHEALSASLSLSMKMNPSTDVVSANAISKYIDILLTSRER